MRHFSHLSRNTQEEIFHKLPVEFNNSSPKELLSATLGASLYSPSTRENLAQDVVKNAKKGLTSLIICLEDSIADADVAKGEANIRRELPKIGELPASERPSLFIRIRNPEHLHKVANDNYENLDVLTGFVMPKFNGLNNGGEYVDVIRNINSRLESDGRKRLYFMPVLESPELVYRESRDAFLTATRSALDGVRDSILAVRVGATDMSSAYGLRRSRDLTIYDVHVISSAIADVANVFARHESGYQVTGAVWEHFTDRERLFKPSLRASPFRESESRKMRAELVLNDLDSLIREIELDRANGILGKTVIHPLHVSLVNSMSIVTHEEYADALVLVNGNGSNTGAVASTYRNKMNEQKPHYPWATKTLVRAQAFGVSNPDIKFADILRAGIAEYV